MPEPLYVNRGFGLKQAIGGQLVRDYASPLVERMRAEGFRLVAGDLTFLLAQEFGFCYGVDRAIEYAYETHEKFPDRRVFITGEIIHNPGVNGRLRAMDIRFLDGSDAGATIEGLHADDVVILPAFGVPLEDMARLRERGVVLVDTTCGSVLNVWKNVEKYARDGFTALIHGKYAHEETRATASRALKHPGGRYLVVRDMEQTRAVCAYLEAGGDRDEFVTRFAPAASPGFDPDLHLERIGCANQTTMLSSESLAIAEAVRQSMIRRWGAEGAASRFRSFDTICSATQERQDALYALLDAHRPDLMIVIGGYNSSNTTHLLEIGIEKGVATYHIQSAACLESERVLRHQPLHAHAESRVEGWFPQGPLSVGVTAGASTPNGEIEAVMRRIAAFRGQVLPGGAA
jgi:4-hydroxy-3-methylbut-2-enyl diphosphate reductase